MNIQYMREYIMLVENLNFTNTANKLFIAQSSLSRHVATIEEELGAQLLIRTKHDVEVTPIGDFIYEKFKNIVKLYDEMLLDTAMLTSGYNESLSIGMLYYAVNEYVTPTVKEYKRRYPHVKLNFSSCQPQQLIQQLIYDEIDVGFIMHIDISNADNFQFHDIFREKLFIICSDKHDIASYHHVKITDLLEETLIFSKRDYDLNNYLKHLLLNNGISPEHFVFTDMVDTIPLAIEETNGIAIVPSHVRNMKRDNMVFIEIDHDDFYIDMAIAYKNSNNNRNIKPFVKCATETSENLQ